MGRYSYGGRGRAALTRLAVAVRLDRDRRLLLTSRSLHSQAEVEAAIEEDRAEAVRLATDLAREVRALKVSEWERAISNCYPLIENAQELASRLASMREVLRSAESVWGVEAALSQMLLEEPAVGSVVMAQSETGTVYQRHYSDGLWHGTGGLVLTWDELRRQSPTYLALLLEAPREGGDVAA